MDLITIDDNIRSESRSTGAVDDVGTTQHIAIRQNAISGHRHRFAAGGDPATVSQVQYIELVCHDYFTIEDR